MKYEIYRIFGNDLFYFIKLEFLNSSLFLNIIFFYFFYSSALGCSDIGVILTAVILFPLDSARRSSLTLSIAFGMVSPVIYPLAMIAQVKYITKK
jgi:hypothetical protein